MLLMKLLVVAQLSGSELVKASAGQVKLNGVYTQLSRLESRGYVRAAYSVRDESSDTERPQLRYYLTPMGVEVLGVYDAACAALSLARTAAG